ncbi:UNVERIFIED_CONTAM: hypothetical protein K2H54_035530 [Gekko kuhli]
MTHSARPSRVSFMSDPALLINEFDTPDLGDAISDTAEVEQSCSTPPKIRPTHVWRLQSLPLNPWDVQGNRGFHFFLYERDHKQGYDHLSFLRRIVHHPPHARYWSLHCQAVLASN